MTHPHKIRGTLLLLFYKVFAKTHGCGSRDTPYPIYALHTQGCGGTGLKNPKNLPALEDHLCAKFHQDPSSCLAFYREHTQTLPPLEGLKSKNNKTGLKILFQIIALKTEVSNLTEELLAAKNELARANAQLRVTKPEVIGQRTKSDAAANSSIGNESSSDQALLQPRLTRDQ